MKYFNGTNWRDIIILYRRQGDEIVEDRIRPSSFQWYFCVKKRDFLRYRELFKDFLHRGLVIRYGDDGDFVKIYCSNKNLWNNDFEVDAKTQILEELDKKVQTYEADLSSLERYVLDKNIQIEDDYQIGYFDIETKDVSHKLIVGNSPILSIALVDDLGNEYVWCSSNERKLLIKAMEKLSQYQILCGWYSKGFDWDYIRARCKCYGLRFPLWHVNHVDMMEWFTEAVRTGGIKEKVPSFSLDNVAQQFLGRKKTEGVSRGHGAIWRLFNENPDLLKEYNKNDCRLLKELDDKLHITEQIIRECKICGTFISRKSHTELIDKYLLRLARKRGTRLPTRIRDRKRPLPPPGGRVYLKKPGLYDNVLAFDFSGFYNSIMRTLNIGIDTIRTFHELRGERYSEKKLTLAPHCYLGNYVVGEMYKKLSDYDNEIITRKVNPLKESMQVRFLTDASFELVKEKAQEVLRELQDKFTLDEENFAKYILQIRKFKGRVLVQSRRYVFFIDAPSIVIEALESFTEERNKFKKKLKELIAKGVEENDPEYVSAKIMNNAFKLLGNVIYGQAAYPKSRLYNENIPPSITIGAQICINILARWFEKNNCDVIYIDTDSNYVQIRDYTKEKQMALVDKVKNEFNEYLKKNLCSIFKIDPAKFCVELEFEKVWKRAAFFTKKRYAGLAVWDKSHGDIEKIDITGLDFVRRETIEFAAKLQKKLLSILLKSKKIPDSRKIYDWVKKIREKFFNTDWNEGNIHLLTKRVIIRKKPEEYRTEPVHSRIQRKMEARGDTIEYGSILEYVIIENTRKNMRDGEEVSFFLKNRELYNLNLHAYWNKEIYSKIRKILQCIFPEEDWFSLDTVINERSDKRFSQLQRRSLKVKEREKTLDMILSYKYFDRSQRLKLIEGFIAMEKEYFPEGKLLERARIELEKAKLGELDYYEYKNDTLKL